MQQQAIDFAQLARDFKISFDPSSGGKQTEEYFFADVGEGVQRFHIHDYNTIYSIPFLYEAVLFGALQCRSPYSIIDILQTAADQAAFDASALRVLEIGAGSGLFGELLRSRLRVQTLVGLDLSPAAKQAAERTRPGLYDAYLTADVTTLEARAESLAPYRFNFIGGVSATGPGHIPPEGLDQAFTLLEPGGLFLFHARGDDGNLGPAGYNVHAEWLRRRKASPEFNVILDEPSFHRRTVDGGDIFYQVLLAQKRVG